MYLLHKRIVETAARAIHKTYRAAAASRQSFRNSDPLYKFRIDFLNMFLNSSDPVRAGFAFEFDGST